MAEDDDAAFTMCSWCARRFCPKSSQLSNLTCCSEICFSLSRRASFKQNKAKGNCDKIPLNNTSSSSGTPDASKTPPLPSNGSVSDASDEKNVEELRKKENQFIPPISLKSEPLLQQENSDHNGICNSPVIRGSSSSSSTKKFPLNSHTLNSPPTLVYGPSLNVPQTVPIYVPMPILIPIPIFKKAPELLRILAKYGYRYKHRRVNNSNRPTTADPSNGLPSRNNHITADTIPLTYPIPNSIPTFDITVTTNEQDEALDLTIHNNSGTKKECPPISSQDKGDYTNRRRRILDASPPDSAYTSSFMGTHAMRHHYKRNRRFKKNKIATMLTTKKGK